ncbi:MAG: hypothetical protein H6814_06860 [Phycisphaeraceae bacterium]|nr:hypothetical protein [Phycisphaeraceae bacterium]
MTIESWSAFGVTPDRLAVKAPGFSGKITTYKGNLGRLEKVDWGQVRSISMCKLDNNGVDAKHDYVVRLTVFAQWSYVSASVLIARCGVSMAEAGEWCDQLLMASYPKYGYLFRQPMYRGPIEYTLGMNLATLRFHLERPAELGMNISWWNREAVEKAGHVLLRDIYPKNYLSESHLSAPIGLTAMTLREWIEDDPVCCGALAQFTDELTEWRPPLERIPEIREGLFRAGRVFYWRFCNPSNWDPELGEHVPEPYKRPDLTAPWEASGPTPEIFTAEFYKDKDPGLTY